MMKKLTFLLFLWVSFSFGQQRLNSLSSQKIKTSQTSLIQKPVYKKADFFRVSKPLIEMVNEAKAMAIVHNEDKEKNEENEWHPVIRNNGLNAPDPLSRNQNYKRSVQVANLNSLIDFDGVSNLDGVATT